MSKRIKRLIPPVAAASLVLASLLFGNHYGTSAQRAAVAPVTARNAAIVAATAEVLRDTSEIRELGIVRPVKSGAQSREQIEHMLVTKLDEQMTREQMHATELTLRKFGLVAETFEYRPFIIKLLTEQVAGYYDAKTRQFYLADWLELEGQKPVMSHELTHALQDQHFNLQRFENWPKGDSDAELAVHALIEGDATLAMTLYMAKNPLVALAFSRSLSGMAAASKQFNESPRALRDTLIFPYFQGMEWTTAVYKRGGWKMVSDAYSKLPQSSEQILHPEKYFAYEQAVKVTMPDLTNLLNESRQQKENSNQQSAVSYQHARPRRGKITHPPTRPSIPNTLPTPDRWRRVEYDVNGEWGYYLILDQFLNSAAESKRAAAGWAGDRYSLYEGPAGQLLLAHLSEWDTPNDAEEFFNAYVKRTTLRYPGSTLMSDMQQPSPNTIRRWQTSEGGVRIELHGSRVMILEGIANGVDENRLIRALVGSS